MGKFQQPGLMQDRFDSRLGTTATFAMLRHALVLLAKYVACFLPVLPFLRIIEQRLPFSPLFPGGPTSPLVPQNVSPFMPMSPLGPIAPGGPSGPISPESPFSPGQDNG